MNWDVDNCVRGIRNEIDDLTERIRVIYHTHSLTSLAHLLFFFCHFWIFYAVLFGVVACWTSTFGNFHRENGFELLLNRWWKFNTKKCMKHVWHELYYVWLGFERVTSIGFKNLFRIGTSTHTYMSSSASMPIWNTLL